MNTIPSETKITIIYIFFAYTFSVLMRLIWVYHFNGYAPFYFNDQFMINTNDGYLWAEGARDLLHGSGVNPDAKEYLDRFHQLHDLSPVGTAASQLTAFFAKILPFSFESVIFYMPAFLSSLVVVPIVLISKSFKNLEAGFIAALLASIAWSYYNRTMAGYYDTDMLNIVLPMFLLWSIMWAIQTQKDVYLLLSALDILVYRWWYPQSYSLEFAFFGLILIYALIYDRKNSFNYKLLAIMMFAMMQTYMLVRLSSVLVVFYIFKQKKFDKYIYYILSVSIIAFFITGGFAPIWNQLKGYVFRESVDATNKGLGLHFFTVMQTVREAGKIPFETFANRISGSVIVFFISCIGYIYLLFKKRIMFLSLPLVGLGFLAYVGGLRFTIYAVPILALGIGFLISELSSNISNLKIRYPSMIILTLAILYPNYKHIDAYKVPTVFSKQEVMVLDKLKHIAQREDYVVSWWDFGYPIRYYTDVKTLADGGKHSGSVDFPLSYILTNPQQEAAKMARLDVEYTEKNFRFKDSHKKEIKDKNFTIFSNIEQMTKDYGFNDTNDFLLNLKTKIKLPKKTRDIYFYLPFRMMGIFPTVARFSNIDLMSGNTIRRPFFYQTNRFKEKNNILYLGSGIAFYQKKGILKIGNQKVLAKSFYVTYYEKNGKLIRKKQLLHQKGDISIIYMRSYRTFLLLDQNMLNSLYIQLFVFDNYDKKLFKPIILTPSAKIYKLLI